MSLGRLAILAGLVAALVWLAADPASAQCAMCRTALEQNGEMAGGFNRGILFLLGMPYLVFVAIGGAWYWKRRQLELREQGAPQEKRWRSELSEQPR